MAIREIRKDGDEILRKKSRQVEVVDDRIRELIEEAETRENIDDFLVKRIKRDLEIVDMPETDELEINIGDKDNE